MHIQCIPNGIRTWNGWINEWVEHLIHGITWTGFERFDQNQIEVTRCTHTESGMITNQPTLKMDGFVGKCKRTILRSENKLSMLLSRTSMVNHYEDNRGNGIKQPNSRWHEKKKNLLPTKSPWLERINRHQRWISYWNPRPWKDLRITLRRNVEEGKQMSVIFEDKVCLFQPNTDE